MTLRNLPAIDAPAFSRALAFEPSSTVLERWNASLRPKNAQNGTVIEIYDVIGFDFWSGEGITAKTISAKLKGAGAVTVNINSPGGDFFEGLAIYNLLRAHEAKVDVQIMGLAASAASIIAMAGDSVQIGKAASLMIHNAWGLRHRQQERNAESGGGLCRVRRFDGWALCRPHRQE
jgi:ATP-dependent Clp protease protease subunit